MNKFTTSELAQIGENIAAKHLITCGFRVVCRNYRQTCGEIDLIVEKNQHLIFVEVKTRSYHSINSALASVSRIKQKRLTRAAQIYVNQNPQFGNHVFRFDIIVVFYSSNSDTLQVKHLENAFYPIMDD